MDNYGFSPAAMKILKERYLHRRDDGTQETIPEMFTRVAYHLAGEYGDKAKRYYDVMIARDFLPNSPTLMNAGKKGKAAQLAACYVLPVEDSMEGIFKALMNMALIHKSGGGTGFNFSELRPKGAKVDGTKGLASGPVSFMELFNAATETVMQGGARRGANLGILDVDHPDILEFIECKRDGKRFQNFNLSVGMTDEFMRDVQRGKMSHRGRAIWDALIDNAWATGDPGLVFLDTINRHDPSPYLGEIRAANPCGESPMHPYEACNLGSINLSNFVTQTAWSAGGQDKVDTYVDWDRLEYVISVAVEMLNAVIDKNVYPLPEIREQVNTSRIIGLGVMGWADMLFKLGIVYGGEASIILAEEVMSFITDRARFYSDGRNDAVTCIAPTGTISLIAGCSSGIEPVFALSHERVIFDKDEDADGNSKREVLTFFDPEFDKAMHDPEDTRIDDGVFVTAHDIAPVQHIKMLAAFQKHTDLGVSKTVNLLNNATKEDVERAFVRAWEMGCKGITVYRDGCRMEQVLYKKPDDGGMDEVCPVCHQNTVYHTDGCKRCWTCGWSPCSV